MLDVLLIDDDPRIQAAMSARLSACGMRVRQCFDGESGLQAVREHAPDAVVLDIRMPGMDGIEVCRRLRMMTQSHNTPVYIVSAETSTEVRDAALAAGATKYLTKPLEPGELVSTLQEVA